MSDALPHVETVPTLRSARLLLRSVTLADEPAVREMCSDHDSARGTCSIPHPYPEDAAKAWILKMAEGLEKGDRFAWVITMAKTGDFLGTTMLEIDKGNMRAEIGYVISKAHRGKGYASEAAACVVNWGLNSLGLQRVFGLCFGWNDASARVMENAGMSREGVHRRHILKWGRFEDAVHFGALKGEWTPPPQFALEKP